MIGRAAPSVALLLVLLATLPARADDLADRLQALLGDHKGQAAVVVKDLKSGAGFTHRPDVPMPTASLIKLPVMVEAYRQAEAGGLDLDALVTLTKDDQVPGSGILTQNFSPGARLSVRDLIRLMIAYSDNTATNLVIDRIGLAATTKAMQELGCPHTKLFSKVYRRDAAIDADGVRQFGIGCTTASEMLSLLERIHRRELVSPAASEAMLSHLYANEDRQMLVRLLPKETKVAHKSGAVTRVRCDAGIIEAPAGPLVVVVLTSENEDGRWTEDNGAELLASRIARTAYDHFNPPGAAPAGPPRLAAGASGAWVETLQRTLNARLAPAPGLVVDGEFGPATEAALRQFQNSRKLPVSAAVDRETWQALAPLVER